MAVQPLNVVFAVDLHLKYEVGGWCFWLSGYCLVAVWRLVGSTQGRELMH